MSRLAFSTLVIFSFLFLPLTVNAQSEVLVPAGSSWNYLDNGTDHILKLSGLEPNTKYYYSVGTLENQISPKVDNMIKRTKRKERLLSKRGDILASAGQHQEAMLTYKQALDELKKLPGKLLTKTSLQKLKQELEEKLKESLQLSPAGLGIKE